MKNKYIVKSLLVLAVTFTMTGCEKNFLDINTNPNNQTNASPDLILPAALTNTASNVNGTLNVLGNLLIGNWGQAPDFTFYTFQESYAFTPSSYDGTWNSLYAGGLTDYNAIEKAATASGAKNYVAIAKIMKAYNFQLICDLWGDVPMTQALNGAAALRPAYDPATTVYDNILTLLNDGISNVDLTPGAIPVPAAVDVAFGGNMNSWLRFANTLKLRILMRQSLVPSRAAQVTAGFATLTSATYLNPSENAKVNPGYANTSGKANPLFTSIGLLIPTGAATNSYRATRGNNFAMTILTNAADPRLQRLYAPVGNTSNYKGVVAGTTAAPGNRSVDLSPVGPGVLPTTGYSAPAYLLTSAEGYFLKAEALLKGYLPGGPAAAQLAYETGIQESFKLLGLTAAAATTYYTASTSPLVNWTVAATTAKQMEAIITQKWIAQNGFNGIEAWTEFRRTGFPSGYTAPLTNVSGGKFPLRLPYVQSEFGTNAANVPQIPNIFDTKIFWEVN